MDGFRWRGAARVVAYLDVVLTSLALVLVIYVTSVLGTVTAVGSLPDQGKMYPFANGTGDWHSSVMINWTIWFIVASMAVVAVIHLWGAVQLLKATDPGRQLHGALKQAANWLNVTVVIVSFQAVGLLFAERYIGLAIWIVTRVTFLYIGCKFMSEVRFYLTSTAAPAHPGLTVVTLGRKNYKG